MSMDEIKTENKEIVYEIDAYTGFGYIKYINSTKVQNVFIKSFVRKYHEKSYYILLNTKGELITEAFEFLNGEWDNSIGKCGSSKRDGASTALKLLYSFLELNNICIVQNIASIPFTRFNSFLLGGTYKGNFIEYNLKTSRRYVTVNKYLSVFRAFFKYLKIDTKYLDGRIITSYTKQVGNDFFSFTKPSKNNRYSNNNKLAKRNIVPKYIKIDEYYKIIELLQEEQNQYRLEENQIKLVDALRTELICHLMFIYGLRIGEVYGLTLEDIEYKEDTLNSVNLLTIRNRYTDKHHQHAKGCMEILSRDDYNNSNYYEDGLGKCFGCEIIEIFDETTSLIKEYLSLSRSIDYLSPKARKNFKKKNIADKVTSNKRIKINRYIFISSRGGPIDRTTNDNYQKWIFNKLGLKIDIESKKDGLNHRYRHGFAMFHKEINNADIIQMRLLLRQANIFSCLKYYNPTEYSIGINTNKANDVLRKVGIKL